jgi:exosortase E/protease (VPEID-CTERM system)
LLLLPLGVVAAWSLNVVRIVALVALGTWRGSEAGISGFHSQAGWLAFNGVALGIIVVTQRLRFFTSVPRAAAEGTNPTAVYLAPFLALIAAIMVTAALSSGFDYLYPIRILAVVAVGAYYWRDYASWQWSCSWSAVAVGFLVFVVWMALERFWGTGTEGGQVLAAGLSDLAPGWAAAWIVCRVAGSVLAVPFAEELAFRGYLTRRLLAADFEQVPMDRFSWFSFVASSACFGALHGRWLAGTLAGMGYGLILCRRGRLSEAVLAHATTNALIAAYVLSTGTWSLWS